MTIRKTLVALLLTALALWGIEAAWIVRRNVSLPKQIQKQAEKERRAVRIQFRDRERALNNDYSQKKHLATGKTVYDRIFNAKEQTIVELIQRMAAESMPRDWNCEVRVEEFTHFVLLIYLPHNLARVEANAVASYLAPVAKHCNQWLTDVAVFDRVHKGFMFFDDEVLKHIELEAKLTEALAEKVRQQGESFTRFNSKTIQFEEHEGHFFLPIQVVGSSGVEACFVLFDTGASVTTISHAIISMTGSDNLTTVPIRSFNTANGLMSCPIVQREVDLGGISRRIEVAVNRRDELNLLGMNYFRGMKYIVDSQGACIYVWEEQPTEVHE